MLIRLVQQTWGTSEFATATNPSLAQELVARVGAARARLALVLLVMVLLVIGSVNLGIAPSFYAAEWLPSADALGWEWGRQLDGDKDYMHS
jgi:hypothetical protein